MDRLLPYGHPFSARIPLPSCLLHLSPSLHTHPGGKRPDPGGRGDRAQPSQAHVFLPDQPLSPGHPLHHNHCPQDAVPIPVWGPFSQLFFLLIADVPLPKLYMLRSLHPGGHGL